MKPLSFRMRQMLATLRDGGKIFDFTDGHTLRALQRRGLARENGRPGYGTWALTPLGHQFTSATMQ